MQLVKYSILLAILSSSIFADLSLLSSEKQNIIKYSNEKVQEDSSKLKKDWISPITYTYTNQKGDTEQRTSVVSISQPIFKSGGIYSAIKYANAVEQYSILGVKLDEKKAIKDAISILFNIYKNKTLIEKQRLIVENAKIDVRNKKESVLNGLLDVSFLNNAILYENQQKSNLLDLEFIQTNLYNSFEKLVNKPYLQFELPTLSLLDTQKYLENNIYIKQSKANIKTKDYYKGIITAKYLPSINANYTFSDNYITDVTTHKYGISVVIPLNINTFNDVASSKLNYLKSKEEERIIVRNEQNILKTQIAKIDTLDKKINLTHENILTYESLLKQMRELSKVGAKTKDDVLVLENSKDIESLNLKIFQYDKQLELLELYARVIDAI